MVGGENVGLDLKIESICACCPKRSIARFKFLSSVEIRFSRSSASGIEMELEVVVGHDGIEEDESKVSELRRGGGAPDGVEMSAKSIVTRMSRERSTASMEAKTQWREARAWRTPGRAATKQQYSHTRATYFMCTQIAVAIAT